jgi:hypothetical protein
MALSMSVGLRMSKLLLRGNVWPKSMAATAVAHGVKLGGAVQSTTPSSLMRAGVTAHGVVKLMRMADGA